MALPILEERRAGVLLDARRVVFLAKLGIRKLERRGDVKPVLVRINDLESWHDLDRTFVGRRQAYDHRAHMDGEVEEREGLIHLEAVALAVVSPGAVMGVNWLLPSGGKE